LVFFTPLESIIIMVVFVSLPQITPSDNSNSVLSGQTVWLRRFYLPHSIFGSRGIRYSTWENPPRYSLP
jgi:hypothetical protein